MNIYNQEKELRELTETIIHESDGWEGILPLKMVFDKPTIELLISACQLALKEVAENNFMEKDNEDLAFDEKMAQEHRLCERCGNTFERAEMILVCKKDGSVREVCFSCRADLKDAGQI
jgi:hypothetical protein